MPGERGSIRLLMSERGHYIRFNVDPLASTQCAKPGGVPPAKPIH